MKKLFYKNKGFTLLEVSIVIAIVVLFSGVVLLNLNTIASKNRAKECSGNLLMLHQAVNNYSIDHNTAYGSTVPMSDLITGEYLDSRESYVCPVHKTAYQTTFTHGIVPVCPDGISGHECSTD